MVLGQALERVEGGGPGSGLGGDGVGDVGGDEGLEEDRGHLVLLDVLGDLGHALRGGLLVGAQAGDGDLVEAEAVGEVAEGGVGGDDVVAGAGRQALGVLLLECLQFGVEFADAVEEVLVALGVDPRQLAADELTDRAVAPRVEPDVGVGAFGLVVVSGLALLLGVLVLRGGFVGVLVLGGLVRVLVLVGVFVLFGVLVFEELGVVVVEQLEGFGDFEGLVRGVFLDGLVERGAEPFEVDDQIGLFDLGDVTGGEFEVVRLDARWSEVSHIYAVAADLFGGEGERVETRDDVDLAVGGIRVVTAGRQRGGGDEPGDGQGEQLSTHHRSLPRDDNHCQHLMCDLSGSRRPLAA
ncbi:hypothetical protein GCM10029992_63150 [Glycomyces albus]